MTRWNGDAEQEGQARCLNVCLIFCVFTCLLVPLKEGRIHTHTHKHQEDVLVCVCSASGLFVDMIN